MNQIENFQIASKV